MKIFIDIGHPAHVHYFKYVIDIWKTKNYKIIVTARDKEVSQQLLKQYEIPYINRGKGGGSIVGKFLYMIKTNFLLLKIAYREKPDIFLSFSSPYAAQVAYFLGRPHIALNDTEHTDTIHKIFTYPFSDCIITPFCYKNELGEKHIKFKGVMESFYLHSDYYTQNTTVVDGLSNTLNKKYVVLRFISWNAHHDYGHSGLNISTKRKLIELLKTKYIIYISSEDPLPDEFSEYQLNLAPHKMHDALSGASFFIGESATMASESSFMGVPSIYVNSLPLMGYLEIEQDIGILKHFPSSEGVVEYLSKFIAHPNLFEGAGFKVDEMKNRFINPTKFLDWFVENYPESKVNIVKDPILQNKDW